MRRKSTRILALLLSLVMLLSASYITAYARVIDYTTPQTDENGKYYFTYEQASSWLMDTLDDLLGTMENGEPVVDESYLGIDIYVDLGSYELLCNSISSTWDEIGGLASAIGDLGDLDADALDHYVKRTDPQKYDYDCLYTLLEFLYDNRSVLRNIANGSFNWGLLDWKISIINDGKSIIGGVADGLLTDLGGGLKKMLYAMLEEMTGRVEGDKFDDATYPANGNDVDGALQDVVDWLIEDTLGIEGVSVNLNDSFYDVVSGLINTLLNNMAVPLLKDVILDACDIEVTEEYPNGSPAENDNDTLTLVLGTVQSLMDQAENYPDYSACAYPGEKIEALLTWFFLDGGMNQYISISEAGISIEDGFVDLLNRLVRLAIPLLHSQDGFDYLPTDYLGLENIDIAEGQPGYMSTAECYAKLVNVLLSGLFMGYYCRPEADSVSAIGAYALASLCARVAPELDYLDALDANYIDNGYTAMPMIKEYTAEGQVASNGSWQKVERTYAVPYAALDMGVTIGQYFLDGLLTANFDAVPPSVIDPDYSRPDNQTLKNEGYGDNGEKYDPVFYRLEKFLKIVVDWAVQKYAPLFENTFSLSSTYTKPGDVWKELDEVLFSIIPSSWLPATIEDHTMDETNTALGLQGNANVPMGSTLDLICGWLLGSVMDFDLQELFGLFSRHDGGDLDSPAVTVILRLVDRLFYLLFGKYCLLPEAGANRNAVLTNTSITTLNALLDNNNLGILLYNLCYALGGKGSSFNANVSAKPLLATVLPLLVSADYIKPFRTEMLNQGEITIGELQNFVDECNRENTCYIDYIVADVDETTEGTYYTVQINVNDAGAYEAVATEVELPENYVEGTTYYTQKFEIAKNVDRFTLSDAAHKYYTQKVTYKAVTLNGENFDPNATYCDTAFTPVSADATTNGYYYSAQNESSLVCLPENYVAGTTYYTHNIVAVGGETSGSYMKKIVTYELVELAFGNGKYIEGKNYYVPKQTVVEYDYMAAYDESTHLMSMGVYTSGSKASKGNGSYGTSIAGTDFYIFREQEDFPNALYTYNNYTDFIDEAEDFVDDYKNFLLNDVPKAYAAWQQYAATGNEKDIPDDEMYMYYKADGNYSSTRIQKMGLSTDYNNLQVIRDIKTLYGDDYLTLFSGVAPVETLNHGKGASNNDLSIAVYNGYKTWIEELQKYSDGLNNYYDGINYYLSASEQGRKSYNETSVTPLIWILNLTEEVYNNGENKDASGNKIYTDKTYEAFRKAYVAASDVVSQANLKSRAYRTTQSMVTKTRNGLIDAYYGLIKFGERADLTQLYQYLITARRIRNAENALIEQGEATYTQSTFETLCKILDAAAVLYDSTPGFDEQGEVDTMASKLYAAINALAYNLSPAIEVKEDVGEENTISVGEPWLDSGITYGYIYGVPEVTGYVYQGAGDPSIAVKGIAQDGVTYNSTSRGPGTGSFIVGKSAGDVTKFRYTIVMFGDINGDARIDGSDKTAIDAYAAQVASNILTGEKLVAADVTGDGVVNASDAAAIQMVMEYKATINQAANVIGTRVIMK